MGDVTNTVLIFSGELLKKRSTFSLWVTPKRDHNGLRAKVAVFPSSLDIAQMETKGTVLITNADEMLNFTHGEEKHLEKVRSSVLLLIQLDLKVNR
jgi:chaperonin GroEL (HSP60 family)